MGPKLPDKDAPMATPSCTSFSVRGDNGGSGVAASAWRESSGDTGERAFEGPESVGASLGGSLRDAWDDSLPMGWADLDDGADTSAFSPEVRTVVVRVQVSFFAERCKRDRDAPRSGIFISMWRPSSSRRPFPFPFPVVPVLGLEGLESKRARLMASCDV